jgi:ATP-dependent helicase HrpA
VDLKVLRRPVDQRRELRHGVRRLVLLACSSPIRTVLRGLPGPTALALSTSPYPSITALADDALTAAADVLIARVVPDGLVWDQSGFESVVEAVRPELADLLEQTLLRTASVLAVARSADAIIKGLRSLSLLSVVADERAHCAHLVRSGFISATGFHRLPDLVRYVHAAQVRLEKAPERLHRDRDAAAAVARVSAAVDELLKALPDEHPGFAAARELPWQVEEFRVSLFAPTIRTAGSVSEQRITKAIASIRAAR